VSVGALDAGPQHRYRSAARVCVEFTATDHLSGPAFTTMREEATRIWLRHGVALTWSTQPAGAACAAVVPLVLDAVRMASVSGGKYADALAITVFSGHSRVIYVSVPRAFKMLTHLREITSIESGGERDLRGGTLIGRIVAHELGHVLLTTMSHSRTGLMRPVFGLRDVLSADDRMTELSSIETDRLAMRFSLVPLESPNGPPAIARRSR
jgi:hypothetical protein